MKDKGNRPWYLIYHLAITPYLVLNMHWAGLLICPSERRRKKEKREKEEVEKKRENVQEKKTAEDAKNEGKKGGEITEHFYDTQRENMSQHPP